MINNVTMGSDAEVFLQTMTGQIFPSCGLIGGSKQKPRDLGDGYAVQEDNVLMEFNIPPQTTMQGWSRAIREGLRRSSKLLPQGLSAQVLASAEIDEVYLMLPAAREFGCEPDFNVWQRSTNPRPHSKNLRLRTAAAHVHIGWDNPTMNDKEALVKAADLYAAVPSLWEDGDKRRRELYGKAGAFRDKAYGVEHRVLSNYWIADENMSAVVYNRYMQAVNFVNNGGVISEEDGKLIQCAINEVDMSAAKLLKKKYKLG